MENNSKFTVGEIVTKNFSTASVFSKHGIDFCCGGDKTLDDACKEQSVDIAELQKELDEAVQNKGGSIDFNSWSLKLLADYIEENYHAYIKEKAPVLLQLLKKIVEVHGGRHPELLKINELFSQSAMALSMHLQKEEQILFPLIRQISDAAKLGISPEEIHCGSVQNPISVMMAEHETEGERFEAISKLSGKYQTPADGCNTYRATYEALDEFERKLHEHIHLENNILFPKAIELEKSFY